MPPLISEEEIDVMDSGDEPENEYISMEMLEDISEGSKYHLLIPTYCRVPRVGNTDEIQTDDTYYLH